VVLCPLFYDTHYWFIDYLQGVLPVYLPARRCTGDTLFDKENTSYKNEEIRFLQYMQDMHEDMLSQGDHV
jgi:hypothetical protein